MKLVVKLKARPGLLRIVSNMLQMLTGISRKALIYFFHFGLIRRVVSLIPTLTFFRQK